MRLRSTIICLGILLPAFASGAHGQSPPACNGNAQKRTEFKNWVAQFAAAATSDTAAANRRLWLHLPKVSAASKVQIITAKNTCKSARTAYASAVGKTASTLSVILLKVDTVYVVTDTTVLNGGYTSAAVLGTTFVLRKGFFW